MKAGGVTIPYDDMMNQTLVGNTLEQAGCPVKWDRNWVGGKVKPSDEQFDRGSFAVNPLKHIMKEDIPSKMCVSFIWEFSIAWRKHMIRQRMSYLNNGRMFKLDFAELERRVVAADPEIIEMMKQEAGIT